MSGSRPHSEPTDATSDATSDGGKDGAEEQNTEPLHETKTVSNVCTPPQRRQQPFRQKFYYVAPLRLQSLTPPSTPEKHPRHRERYFQHLMATSSMGPASPSSSPRLPSPPPFPEVQIGPKSPGMNASPGAPSLEDEDTSKLDQGAMRRIRPGTKAADMASGPPLVPLAELDSPFQLQEHLKALHHHHTRSPNAADQTQPLTHETALAIATPPPNIDRSLWLYELTRFLVVKANDLIVSFFGETPPCSAQTCPEMRASEWQYLCAVHEPPKPCCAIDYCCHTLDWAAYTLASQKHFPSRLTLGSEASGGSQQGVRQLTNIMRRVYRIFAHAWFQHRQVFWQVEGNEGLYVLFKTVCDVYSLIPEENYTIPPEAEGLAANAEEKGEGKDFLKRQASEESGKDGDDGNEDATTTISTGATTRRHKHTPSVGSTVTTIAEGDEDADSPAKSKAGGPLETMPSSMLREVPLAQISKTAEKADPAQVESRGEKPPTQPTETAAATIDDKETKGPDFVENETEQSHEALPENGQEAVAETPAVSHDSEKEGTNAE